MCYVCVLFEMFVCEIVEGMETADSMLVIC